MKFIQQEKKTVGGATETLTKVWEFKSYLDYIEWVGLRDLRDKVLEQRADEAAILVEEREAQASEVEFEGSEDGS